MIIWHSVHIVHGLESELPPVYFEAFNHLSSSGFSWLENLVLDGVNTLKVLPLITSRLTKIVLPLIFGVNMNQCTTSHFVYPVKLVKYALKPIKIFVN